MRKITKEIQNRQDFWNKFKKLKRKLKNFRHIWNFYKQVMGRSHLLSAVDNLDKLTVPGYLQLLPECNPVQSLLLQEEVMLWQFIDRNSSHLCGYRVPPALFQYQSAMDVDTYAVKHPLKNNWNNIWHSSLYLALQGLPLRTVSWVLQAWNTCNGS